MESRSFWIKGSKMFRLRDLKNGFYQIHKKNGQAFEGTPTPILQAAIKMGVSQNDLIAATLQLQKDNKDYADFNEYGRLRYCKRNGE
jgi:hypothetical protein